MRSAYEPGEGLVGATLRDQIRSALGVSHGVRADRPPAVLDARRGTGADRAAPVVGRRARRVRRRLRAPTRPPFSCCAASRRCTAIPTTPPARSSRRCTRLRGRCRAHPRPRSRRSRARTSTMPRNTAGAPRLVRVARTSELESTPDECARDASLLNRADATRRSSPKRRSSANAIESHVLPFAWILKRGRLSADEALQLGGAREGRRDDRDQVADLAREGRRHRSSRRRPRADSRAAHDARHRRLRAPALRHRARAHEHRLLRGARRRSDSCPKSASIEKFRRSLDIAGHVSWVPGGTPLGSGRLGVMMPVGTGLALGLKARKGADAFVVCHCGDAGWISGQALERLHRREPAQGADRVRDAPQRHPAVGHDRADHGQDPRPIIASLGIEILEIPSLHDRAVARPGVRRGVHARAGGPSDADLSGRLRRERHAAGDRAVVRRDVRHRRRGRGVCGEAQRRARHANPRARLAHELSRRARR